jgi:hypothetical protein
MYRIMALESNDPSAELVYILARKLPALCPPSPGTIDNNEWHAISAFEVSAPSSHPVELGRLNLSAQDHRTGSRLTRAAEGWSLILGMQADR